jgi:hypothetical protein
MTLPAPAPLPPIVLPPASTLIAIAGLPIPTVPVASTST